MVETDETAKKIEESRRSLSEALVEITGDRLVAGYIVSAAGKFAKEGGLGNALYIIKRDGGETAESVILMFGRGKDEVKIGIKQGRICAGIPATSAYCELQGQLRVTQESEIHCLVFETVLGGRMTVGIIESAVVSEAKTPMSEKKPVISLR